VVNSFATSVVWSLLAGEDDRQDVMSVVVSTVIFETQAHWNLHF